MDKQDLMKIISQISVSAPDGATIQISESNGKFVIELQPKTANNKVDDDPPTVIDSFGVRTWRNSKGQIHRDGDKPAVVYADGTKEWFKNGLYHRDGDKPAIICANGNQCWYKNGLRCREGDKPAIIYANGDKYWYKNGEYHRDGNKPAVITKFRYEYWVDDKHVMTINHKDGVVEV